MVAGDGEDCLGDRLVLIVRWPPAAEVDDDGSRAKVGGTGGGADVDDILSSALWILMVGAAGAGTALSPSNNNNVNLNPNTWLT